LLHTNNDVFDALEDLESVRVEHQEVYARFQRTFAHLEDGGAAARVADRFFPDHRSPADAVHTGSSGSVR